MTDGIEDSLWAHRLIIDACLEADVPFFWQGPGTLLLPSQAAGAILDRVLPKGTVLGVEGFELDATVHPRLDLILDASKGGGLDFAASVAEWGEGVWVDLTLGPPKPT